MKVTLAIKNKVEVVVQKWLVFSLPDTWFSSRKIWTKSRIQIRRLARRKQWKLSKVRQSKPCYHSRIKSWLCCCTDSKVVYFKWTVLDFVSEILFNIFLLFTRKLCFIKFCSTSLAKLFLRKLLTSRNFIETHLQEVFNMLEVSFFKKSFFGYSYTFFLLYTMI